MKQEGGSETGTDGISPAERRLSLLWRLSTGALSANNLQEITAHICNETEKIVPYNRAVLFIFKKNKLRMLGVSGIPSTPKNTPYEITLTRTVNKIKKEQISLSKDDVEDRSLKKSWDEWMSTWVLWQPLHDSRHRECAGGLWLERATPFDKAEKFVLEELSRTYGYALGRHAKDRKKRFLWRIRWSYLLIAVVAVLLFLPVPNTNTVEGIVQPGDPVNITAPYEGVIETLKVQPNQTVKAGDIVAYMEADHWRHELQVAAKALEVARANLNALERRSFTEKDRKLEIDIAQSIVAEKQQVVDGLREKVERGVLKTPIEGTVIMEEKHKIEGRPLRTGETIITVAKRDDMVLTIHVPVDDAINIEGGNGITFYLNTDPLTPIPAVIERSGYRAMETDTGERYIPVLARFTQVNLRTRIGLRGQAVLHGDSEPLWQVIARRPIIVLRRLMSNLNW